MTRVGITGHTSGIGLACATMLQGMHFEIVGFSRSTGYNITEPEARSRIVAESSSCSIFINNAHQDWEQANLLYELFEQWRDQDKIIFNISSNSSDGVKDYLHKYAVQKAALDKACEQLSNIAGVKCRVVNLRPGWVRTPRVEHLNVTEPMLSPEDIAATIRWIIELPRNVNVPNIRLQARN